MPQYPAHLKAINAAAKSYRQANPKLDQPAAIKRASAAYNKGQLRVSPGRSAARKSTKKSRSRKSSAKKSRKSPSKSRKSQKSRKPNNSESRTRRTVFKKTFPPGDYQIGEFLSIDEHMLTPKQRGMFASHWTRSGDGNYTTSDGQDISVDGGKIGFKNVLLGGPDRNVGFVRHYRNPVVFAVVESSKDTTFVVKSAGERTVTVQDA